MNNKDIDSLMSENFQFGDFNEGGINEDVDIKADRIKNKIVFRLRKIQCIQQLLAGRSPFEIAKALNISENTVEFYLVKGIKKLNVK